MKKNTYSIFHDIPFFASVPALMWQLLFLGIPLTIILYFSFTKIVDGTTIFTLGHFANLRTFTYGLIILRSFFLALGASICCLFLGYPVAYFIAIRARTLKTLLLFLLTLPFWTNFLVQVYAWYYVLEYHGILNTFFLKLGIISEPLRILNSVSAIFLLLIYCYIPFMIMPLYSILEKIDTRLLEASSDLGATPWQTFARITLPLSYQGIQTGFLLVLVPAFGEFAIYALVGGSKYMSVGSLITYFFLVARNVHLGSAFTIMSGTILITVVMILYVFISGVWSKKQRT